MKNELLTGLADKKMKMRMDIVFQEYGD